MNEREEPSKAQVDTREVSQGSVPGLNTMLNCVELTKEQSSTRGTLYRMGQTLNRSSNWGTKRQKSHSREGSVQKRKKLPYIIIGYHQRKVMPKCGKGTP